MTAADVQPYRCDAEHARQITDQIRAGVEKVHQLLVRSYEWEAWRALGYPSWRDYAATEFGISKSRAYQLLDQARVIKEIEAVAGDSTIVELAEGATRELAPIIRDHGPGVAAEVLAQAAASGPVTAVAIRQAAEDTGRRPAKTPPTKPYRRPLPDAFFTASHDLAKTAKSLHNLTTDDRWSRNVEQVTRYRSDLLATRELIDQILAAMPNNNSTEG